jgi:hypothetical protein
MSLTKVRPERALFDLADAQRNIGNLYDVSIRDAVRRGLLASPDVESVPSGDARDGVSQGRKRQVMTTIYHPLGPNRCCSSG